MHPMLNIAIKAARQAGTIIMRSVDRIDSLTIEHKDANDFVSEVDRKAEEQIIHTLLDAYPTHSIMAEEGGSKEGDDFEWIIDPLDGTTNYLYGFPQFSVSIALRNKGRLEQAVVYDPLKDELFTASRGSGAMLNNKRIRVTGRKDMQSALLGTGVPFRPDQDLDTYLETMRVLIPQTAGVRRAGSAALDLAYVAAGRLDGFWEFGLKPWDMAAGILLIEEAGGLVGDLSGGPNHMRSGNVLAGSPKVFKHMAQRLRSVLG